MCILTKHCYGCKLVVTFTGGSLQAAEFFSIVNIDFLLSALTLTRMHVELRLVVIV